MDTPAIPVEKAKVRRKRRWWLWVIVAVFVLLPVSVIGWSGLWNVPVLSTVFGTSKPKNLGVKSSPEALATALRDNPMTFSGDTSTWYGLAKRKFSGSVPIDDVHSSEEVTSFINLGIGGHRYARDIQVKFHPGGMELSAFVVPYIKAPVYADIDVARTSNKSVAITVKNAKVGRLTVPKMYWDDINREATKWVNARLAEVDGLSLETLEYRDNAAYLKGTLPQTVEQVTGEEYDVFGQDLRKL